MARGVVAGIAKALGQVNPDPVSTPVAFPPFGTSRNLRHPRTITVTVPRLRVRMYAETDQPIVTEWTEGTAFAVSGWIIGENVEGNPIWWLTERGEPSGQRWRVWSGGTTLAGHGVLDLPVAP